MLISSIWFIDRSDPESNGSAWALCIPQISKTATSLLDCLVSYQEHILDGVS